MTQKSWLFSFAFSPWLPSCFTFLASLFFVFCWSLISRLHFGWKRFWKGFRILPGLVENKVWKVLEQDFHGNFRANFPCFFFRLFLWPPWLNCAHSGMVWNTPSLCTSKQTKFKVVLDCQNWWHHKWLKGCGSCKWFLAPVGGSGWYWCEWVKVVIIRKVSVKRESAL